MMASRWTVLLLFFAALAMLSTAFVLAVSGGTPLWLVGGFLAVAVGLLVVALAVPVPARPRTGDPLAGVRREELEAALQDLDRLPGQHERFPDLTHPSRATVDEARRAIEERLVDMDSEE